MVKKEKLAAEEIIDEDGKRENKSIRASERDFKCLRLISRIETLRRSHPNGPLGLLRQ